MKLNADGRAFSIANLKLELGLIKHHITATLAVFVLARHVSLGAHHAVTARLPAVTIAFWLARLSYISKMN